MIGCRFTLRMTVQLSFDVGVRVDISTQDMSAADANAIREQGQ